MTHDHWPAHIHDTRPFDGCVVCHGCGQAVEIPLSIEPSWCAKVVRGFVTAHIECAPKGQQ